MYEDKKIICKNCGNEFIFTARDQEFYESKGFKNEPKSCPDCRRKRKEEGNEKKLYTGVCANCGKEAIVPFEPKDDRPIYCSSCFASMK